MVLTDHDILPGPDASKPNLLKFPPCISAEGYKEATDAQHDLITSITSLYPTLDGPQLKERIAELFAPFVLFGSDI